MQSIQDLGALVEGRWRDWNYNEDLFPEIAAQALAEANLIERLDPWEIVRWAQTTDQLPPQQDVDGAFGNPPITLYVGPRFYIDVYYWLDGTTTIHQHAFSGAFQVLLGSSIQASYTFKTTESVNRRLKVGTVCLNEVNLLQEKDIRPILPGPDFIHSLFHLERPSATITVRTFQDPHHLPQYKYLRPHLAMDPFHKDASIMKKTQSVSLLLGMQHPEADSFICDIIARADFETTVAVLEVAHRYLLSNELDRLFGLSTGRDRCDHFLAMACAKHGQLGEVLAPVFAELQRQENLIRRRSMITDEAHRFFLALLLNVPDRERLLALVKARLPNEDPIDIVIDWIMDLKATKVVGSPEPNVLGIDIPDDAAVFLLEGLLLGHSDEKIIAQARRESEHFQQEHRLEELLDALKSSLVFKSVFAG